MRIISACFLGLLLTATAAGAVETGRYQAVTAVPPPGSEIKGTVVLFYDTVEGHVWWYTPGSGVVYLTRLVPGAPGMPLGSSVARNPPAPPPGFVIVDPSPKR